MYSKLFLHEHTHLCLVDDSVVFLNLYRNTYLTVPPATLSALARHLAGFSALLPSHHRIATLTDGTNADLEALVNRGILTASPNAGKFASPVALTPAARSLVSGARSATSDVTCASLVTPFLLSYCHVGLNIRGGRLDRMVTKLKARNARRTGRTARVATPDRLQPVLASFRRLRTFSYTAHNGCLFNALVLARFLCHLDFAPTFVIGVRTKPFCAHAWVQLSDCVLDDRLESVHRFTPILAI